MAFCVGLAVEFFADKTWDEGKGYGKANELSVKIFTL